MKYTFKDVFPDVILPCGGNVYVWIRDDKVVVVEISVSNERSTLSFDSSNSFESYALESSDVSSLDVVTWSNEIGDGHFSVKLNQIYIFILKCIKLNTYLVYALYPHLEMRNLIEWSIKFRARRPHSRSKGSLIQFLNCPYELNLSRKKCVLLF